jgi:predicted MPP superfamily phosphohydrolase
MATSTSSLVLAVLLGVAVASFVLVRARRSLDLTGMATIDAPILLAGAWLGVGLGVVQLAIGLQWLEFDRWDLLSIVYLDVTVAVPVVGITVLGAAAHHRMRLRGTTVSRPALVLAALALLPIPIGLYASRVEPYRLRTDIQTIAVAPDRAGDDDLVIGVIADIQTVEVTAHERAAVERVVAARPDIILFAGDVFQGSGAQLARAEEDLRSLFGAMDAPGGAFVVPGDVDSVDVLERLTEGTPVEVIADRVVAFQVGDRRVTIGGVSLTPDGSSEVLRQLQDDEGDDLRILLAHRPDWALELHPSSRVDLVVAGHTHGGQVQLPGVGPLMTLSAVPRDVAAGGLHLLDGNQVYVSTGVGREQQGAPQIRFLARPSVALLTLEG